MRLRTTSTLVLLALGSAGSVLAATGRVPPLKAPISIDGSLTDWTEVLANPRNTTRDGQGAGLASCATSTDADCPLADLSEDIDVFAWTWSDTHLALHLRRYAQGTAARTYVLYVDEDNDSRMESGEPLVILSWSYGTATNSLRVDTYVEATSGGDPLVSPAGSADGYQMPGGRANAPALVSQNVGAVPSQPAWEGAVPWPMLGMTPGAPFQFHVSGFNNAVLNGNNDNLGGADDRVGSTAWRAVGLEPNVSASVAPAATVRLVHVVTNSGNVPATVALSGVSSSGWDLSFYEDLDGDGIGDLYLGTDAGGDGVFTLPGDVLQPLGDTDMDGLLDVGRLTFGELARVVVVPAVPPDATGVTDSLILTAWQPAEPTARDQVQDSIRVGDVTVRPDVTRRGAESDVVWLPHVVQNNTVDSVVVDLEALSSWSWPYSLFTDPNGDGDATDAVPLTDTDASGLPDVRLVSGGQASVFARAAVPPATPEGRLEVALVRAVLAGIPVSAATDTISVSPRSLLEPSYRDVDGDARCGAAGGSIYFAHRLTHSGGAPEVYDLLALSDRGWTITLLSDPDQDGLPFDSEVLGWTSGLVEPNGGVVAFLLRVDVPAGAAVGLTSNIELSAEPRSAPGTGPAVEDDAVVAIVRAYLDPGHVANARSFEACSTVYAAADNLPPATGGLRFHWRDAGSSTLRIQAVSTDASGHCEDALTLGTGQAGPGFTVAIEQLISGSWTALDTAGFDVGDAVSVTSLVPGRPTLHVSGRTLSATASLLNSSFDQAASGLAIRWVVLTDDLAEYLQPNGTFAPYGGTEATRTDLVSLALRATQPLTLTVPSVTFPATGTYHVELWRSVGCAGETRQAEASFEVIDDQDDDGLSRADEVAAGSNPNDADSDDDGLPDAEDGLFDSDGDGLIDALDCDSDDDELPDGLESGVWTPGPGTDVSAGCFIPDIWPMSTTDPDNADSDGGGVPDGVEDRDHDGKRDAGEGDPNDPADDATLDSDGDGLLDLAEIGRGLSPLDQDTDDDGVADPGEPDADSDGDGLADGLDCDSDNDGLPDGLELGLDMPLADTDLGAGCFVADADTATQTDPTRADSDGGGVPDGIEDTNRNGRIDPSEGDPNDPMDDAGSCASVPPLEVTGVRVAQDGPGARITWDAVGDACTSWRIYADPAGPVLSVMIENLAAAEHLDSDALGAERIRYYLVQAVSLVGGPGATGR